MSLSDLKPQALSTRAAANYVNAIVLGTQMSINPSFLLLFFSSRPVIEINFVLYGHDLEGIGINTNGIK